jgi:hypothetical protein
MDSWVAFPSECIPRDILLTQVYTLFDYESSFGVLLGVCFAQLA